MDALLGKIVSVTPISGRYRVDFRPVCTMPARRPTPEWLADQVLSTLRDVADVREIGDPGDSFLLHPAESEKWLAPVVVDPVCTCGELPDSIDVIVRWWHGDVPQINVRANGRSAAYSLHAEEGALAATIPTSDFFDASPSLPVSVEISCGGVSLNCVAVPDREPFCHRIIAAGSEVYRIGNEWITADVRSDSHAAGIESVVETGRGVDHFAKPSGLIQGPFENGGHVDRLMRGTSPYWWDKPDGARMATAGSGDNSGRSLLLEGVIDEGENLRTSSTFRAHPEIPLLLLSRTYEFGIRERNGRSPTGTMADDIATIVPGFRAAWRAEREGIIGSRLIYSDGERAKVVRPVQNGEKIRGFARRIDGGWAIAEHPLRRECTLYLFNPDDTVFIQTWLGPHTIALEPCWEPKLVHQGVSIGYSLGLSVGELCGIGDDGCWVACRSQSEGGVRCGIVARLYSGRAAATFQVGLATRHAEMRIEHIDGIGPVWSATAFFPGAGMQEDFDASIPGLSSRRLP